MTATPDLLARVDAALAQATAPVQPEVGKRDGSGHAGKATVEATGRLPRTRPWPTPPQAPAYYGLAGRLVRAIDPHTEADPVAVRLNLRLAFGCAVGSGPHLLVGAARHPARTFRAGRA